jgi:hypothetical protein
MFYNLYYVPMSRINVSSLDRSFTHNNSFNLRTYKEIIEIL